MQMVIINFATGLNYEVEKEWVQVFSRSPIFIVDTRAS